MNVGGAEFLESSFCPLAFDVAKALDFTRSGQAGANTPLYLLSRFSFQSYDAAKYLAW